MPEPVILLVDNGSTQAAATLSLRRIAAQLSTAIDKPVHPVSLQHANRIAPDALGGEPAQVFASVLQTQLQQGQRRFVVLPLFFGRSRALTSFIPKETEKLAQVFDEFELRLADVLSPMPDGEPVLEEILADNINHCAAQSGTQPDTVIVVDHGSPLAEVTAVRQRVVDALRERLPPMSRVEQAVMERREGRAFDFNGHLLEERLDDLASGTGTMRITIGMLFISPGRHAGPGGDIAQICHAAEQRHPGMAICVSPLVGEHPSLIGLLKQRLDAAF